jgi:hypothetical protein
VQTALPAFSRPRLATARGLLTSTCPLALRVRAGFERTETLGISISTLHQWKVKHEEFYEALQRGKDEANRCVENSLFKRANGFHYETEKVSNGRPMKVTEFLHRAPTRGWSGSGRLEPSRSSKRGNEKRMTMSR